MRRSGQILAGIADPAVDLLATKPAKRLGGCFRDMPIRRGVSRDTDHRDEPRHRRLTDFARISRRGASERVEIINVSASGAQIATSAAYRIGQRVTLAFENGSCAGSVIWQKSGRVGLSLGADSIQLVES